MNDETLCTAAQAALQHAAPQSPQTVFSPFVAFSWPTAIAPKPPVGQTTEERGWVGWTLTCAAYTDTMREAIEATENVNYAVHLKRDGIVADALYKRLSMRADELVRLTEVEEVLGCRWGEIDVELGGHAQRIDPFFWKMLENVVRESISTYLLQLDQSMTALKGLSASELAPAASAAMERVRRTTAHKLSNALLDRNSTTMDIVNTLHQLRTSTIPAHAEATKDLLKTQIRGVLALSRLVASRTDELDVRMQELEQQIIELLANIPPVLEAQFMDRHVSILELHTAFTVPNNGWVDGCCNVPPPSFGVRATVLARWLLRCGEEVAHACVASLSMLRRVADRGLLTYDWAGVELCLACPSDARTRDAPRDAIMGWRPPNHLGATGPNYDPRVVVATAQSDGMALRAARMFKILLDQAQLGLLPAITVRADVLLPIVARFTAEAEIGYGYYVDMHLRPLSACLHIELPVEAPEAAYTRTKQRRVTATTMAPVNPVVGAVQAPPLLPVAVASMAPQGWVDPRLSRDHSILHALCLCLQPLRRQQEARVPLTQIVTKTRGLASKLREASDASLRQAVRHVCVEVIKRATEKAAAEQEFHIMQFSSEREKVLDGRVAGVVCEGSGVLFLFEYACWVVNQMRYDSAAFCAVWKPSRSAQSCAVPDRKRVWSDVV